MSHITENVQRFMESIKQADADLKRLRNSGNLDSETIDLLYASKEATINRAYDELSIDEHTTFTNWLQAHVSKQIEEINNMLKFK